MVKYILVFNTIISFSICTFVTADMIDDSSLEPWETCALCHGLYGDSARSKFPKLAAQKAEYLSKQIKDFQAGKRTNDGGQMQSMVESLTSDNIEQIVNWFSTQPVPKASPEKPTQTDINNLAAVLGGRPKETCGTCHQAASSEPKIKAPASAALQIPFLHAQHADYLAKQMTDFKTGDRHDTLVHHPLLQPLSSDQITLLAEYFASSER